MHRRSFKAPIHWSRQLEPLHRWLCPGGQQFGGSPFWPTADRICFPVLGELPAGECQPSGHVSCLRLGRIGTYWMTEDDGGPLHLAPLPHQVGVSENVVVPLNPMVLLIIIPMKNGYFIGNIPNIFRQTQVVPFAVREKCEYLCQHLSPGCCPVYRAIFWQDTSVKPVLRCRSNFHAFTLYDWYCSHCKPWWQNLIRIGDLTDVNGCEWMLVDWLVTDWWYQNILSQYD